LEDPLRIKPVSFYCNDVSIAVNKLEKDSPISRYLHGIVVFFVSCQFVQVRFHLQHSAYQEFSQGDQRVQALCLSSFPYRRSLQDLCVNSPANVRNQRRADALISKCLVLISFMPARFIARTIFEHQICRQ